MEAPKAGAKPVMIVLDRAADGTWVATPEYAGDDCSEQERPACAAAGAVPPHGHGHHGSVVDTTSRAHKMRLVRWSMACTIIDFKFDVKALIQDYFSLAFDPHTRNQRILGMFRHGEDERSHDMLRLLFAGLVDGDEPVDEAAAEMLQAVGGVADGDEKDNDDGGGEEGLQAVGGDANADDGGGEEGPQAVDGGDDDDADGEQEDEPLRFVKKPLSAAGFVDVRHMRKSIKAFFDPDINVDDEDADDEMDTDFRANFMSATGFVNRLWDLRRIIEVYMDVEQDLETCRATMAKRLGDLEEVLNARARAVSTGRIRIIQ